MEKIDVAKACKELYRAKRTVETVVAKQGTFLAIDGVGEPGGKAYGQAIEKLYSVAYTAKFALKKAGVLDFRVSKLECLWYDDPSKKPISEWRWRLLIRIPDSITEEHLQDSRQEVVRKKSVDASDVERISWEEGAAVQTIHVGPYDEVNKTYAKLADFIDENNLECEGPGHEIYTSDPRRSKPENLKTIVRLPVK